MPLPSSVPYPGVLSEITPHLPNIDTTESLTVTSPQMPFSPMNSEDYKFHKSNH